MYSLRTKLLTVPTDIMYLSSNHINRQAITPTSKMIDTISRSNSSASNTAGNTFDMWPARRAAKSFHKRLRKNHGIHKQVEKFPSRHETYDEEFAKVTTFESQMESLKGTGFRRPYLPYTPPDDMERRFFVACAKVLPANIFSNSTDLSTIKLDEKLGGKVKAELLNAIGETLDHYIPNSMLHEMNSLDKVLHFYSVKITKESSYDRLEAMSKKGQLPPNLHIQLEPVRFDPKAAEEAGEEQDVAKITAFPRSSTIIVNPENRKKYKDVIAKHQPWQNAQDERL